MGKLLHPTLQYALHGLALEDEFWIDELVHEFGGFCTVLQLVQKALALCAQG